MPCADEGPPVDNYSAEKHTRRLLWWGQRPWPPTDEATLRSSPADAAVADATLAPFTDQQYNALTAHYIFTLPGATFEAPIKGNTMMDDQGNSDRSNYREKTTHSAWKECEAAGLDRKDTPLESCYICGMEYNEQIVNNTPPGAECEHIIPFYLLLILVGFCTVGYKSQRRAWWDRHAATVASSGVHRTFDRDLYTTIQDDLWNDTYKWSCFPCNKFKAHYPFIHIIDSSLHPGAHVPELNVGQGADGSGVTLNVWTHLQCLLVNKSPRLEQWRKCYKADYENLCQANGWTPDQWVEHRWTTINSNVSELIRKIRDLRANPTFSLPYHSVTVLIAKDLIVARCTTIGEILGKLGQWITAAESTGYIADADRGIVRGGAAQDRARVFKKGLRGDKQRLARAEARATGRKEKRNTVLQQAREKDYLKAQRALKRWGMLGDIIRGPTALEFLERVEQENEDITIRSFYGALINSVKTRTPKNIVQQKQRITDIIRALDNNIHLDVIIASICLVDMFMSSADRSEKLSNTIFNVIQQRMSGTGIHWRDLINIGHIEETDIRIYLKRYLEGLYSDLDVNIPQIFSGHLEYLDTSFNWGIDLTNDIQAKYGVGAPAPSTLPRGTSPVLPDRQLPHLAEWIGAGAAGLSPTSPISRKRVSRRKTKRKKSRKNKKKKSKKKSKRKIRKSRKKRKTKKKM